MTPSPPPPPRDRAARSPATSAWVLLREGRWAVPPAAVAALLAVLAVVAVGLLVRAVTTVPPPDVAPVAAAAPAEPTGGGAPGERGPQGASASPEAGTATGTGAGSGAAAAQEGAADPSAPVVVHVVGQVAAPGLVRVPAGSRVADAVDAAGGLTAEADQGAVNLARAVVDGEQLVVPRPGEVALAAPAPGAGPVVGPAPAPGAPGPGAPVRLSTATPAELDALPGIGPVLAARIVEWREANGGFRDVEELAEVSGIGDAVLEDLRPLVVV
jgi:competence protein ComEA